MRPTPRMRGLMDFMVYKHNKVPYYQRLFQKHDGVRDWRKTSRSVYMLYPFYALQTFTLSGVLWMMGRMVLGHKTWWGPG